MWKFAEKGFIPQLFSEKFAPANRRHQGIPGIEVLPSGRIFVTWYAGFEQGEGPGNYLLLSTSTDCGFTWRTVHVIAPSHPEEERAFDPVLWLDPQGRLWWFWAQSMTSKLWDIFDGRAGVWAVCCGQPDADVPQWSHPRRLADGVIMNKPTILSDGSWLLPVSLWSCQPDRIQPELDAVSKANFLRTGDNGETFELIVGTRITESNLRSFDEHIMVERNDLTWWLLIRGRNPGIWESFSSDKGMHWTEPVPAVFDGPNSRFALRRLKSGRLVLINHRVPHRLPGDIHLEGVLRNNLTAWLSGDDGHTWSGSLLIDSRMNVSYPDITEGEDGFLYLIYDHARLEHGQIIMARFTEADIAAGDLITPGSCLNLLVDAFVPLGNDSGQNKGEKK